MASARTIASVLRFNRDVSVSASSMASMTTGVMSPMTRRQTASFTGRPIIPLPSILRVSP